MSRARARCLPYGAALSRACPQAAEAARITGTHAYARPGWDSPSARPGFDYLEEKAWNMVTEGAIPYNGTGPVRAAGPPAPRLGPARSARPLSSAPAGRRALCGARGADARDGERGRGAPHAAHAGGGARALGARRAARGAAGHAAADRRGRGRGEPRQRAGRALPGLRRRSAMLSGLPPRLRHDGRVSASAALCRDLRRAVRRLV